MALRMSDDEKRIVLEIARKAAREAARDENQAVRDAEQAIADLNGP